MANSSGRTPLLAQRFISAYNAISTHPENDLSDILWVQDRPAYQTARLAILKARNMDQEIQIIMEDDFEAPKRTSKRPANAKEAAPTTSTANSFAALPREKIPPVSGEPPAKKAPKGPPTTAKPALAPKPATATNATAPAALPLSTPNSRKVPPIVVATDDLPHHALREMVNKVTKQEVRITYLRNGDASLRAKSESDYKEILNLLKNKARACHTYTLESDRLKKTVIRGLCPNLDTDEIRDDLARLGFTPTKVAVMPTGKNPRARPLYLAYFPSSTDMGKLKAAATSLLQCNVQLEKLRANKSSPSSPGTIGTQCYRCQSFGHASANCGRPARCVKCTEPHATSDCPRKDRNEGQPTCCNCNGPHPANYSGCPKRRAYANGIAKAQQSRQPARKYTAGVSFVSATTGAAPQMQAPTPRPPQEHRFPALPQHQRQASSPQAVGPQAVGPQAAGPRTAGPRSPPAPDSESQDTSNDALLLEVLSRLSNSRHELKGCEHNPIALAQVLLRLLLPLMK